MPQPGDYGAYGDTDRAVFDGNAWHVQAQGTVFFGLSGDAPLPLPSAMRSRILGILVGGKSGPA